MAKSSSNNGPSLMLHASARRNKMMWFGGIAVSVSVVVPVGVGVLLGGKNGERRHDRLVWLRNWFMGGLLSKAEERRA
jgi:hypothetical protein